MSQFPGLRDGRQHGTGGIHVGAVAQHHVEENYGGRWIARLFYDPLVAEAVIDHRMGAASGEQIIAQIDHRVTPAGPGVGQGEVLVRRRGRPDVAQHRGQFQQRLMAERPAAEQAAQTMSVGRHRGRHGIDPERRETAAACGHGEVGGLFQAAREGEGRIGRNITPPAEKIDDHRFAGRGGLFEDSGRDGGRRRL